MEYCVFSSYILLHRAYFHMPPFPLASWDAFFVFLWFSHPVHKLKIVWAATEPLTLCSTVALGRDPVIVAWGRRWWEGWSWVTFCGSLCNSQSLQFPLPPSICEAPVGITLQVRRRDLPKDLWFRYAAEALSRMLTKVKQSLVLEKLPPRPSHHVTF